MNLEKRAGVAELFDKERMSKVQKPLVVFDMANNHNGNVNRGLEIIREVYRAGEEFKDNFIFGFKFQYRELDSFIHPDFKDRKDIKYVKRFLETRLKEEEFKLMKEEIDKLGFVSICTPFDEKSVELIEKHSYDIIKIGSYALTDWPLLEKIVKTDKPIIASTGGNSLEDIDKVFTFFVNRSKKFCLMHCVSEYPTENKNLQLNQIDLLKERYPNINIGFSTHEAPDNLDAVKIAVAKGALIFEKHVAIGEVGKDRNAYSADPLQVKLWLKSAKDGLEMAGLIGERVPVTEKEKLGLIGLRRAVFAKTNIKAGERVASGKVFYAIPGLEGQLFANDMSKYTRYYAKQDIGEGRPIMIGNLEVNDLREKITRAVYGGRGIKEMLNKANLPLPKIIELELSHHYGIDKFNEFGCTIINVINRDYCKKWIVVLPGQTNPTHRHEQKEESFIVNYGDVVVNINGEEKEYTRGETILVNRGDRHSFTSKDGGIFEEISTTHYKDDSFYEDKRIMENPERKTHIRLWLDR